VTIGVAQGRWQSGGILGPLALFPLFYKISALPYLICGGAFHPDRPPGFATARQRLCAGHAIAAEPKAVVLPE